MAPLVSRAALAAAAWAMTGAAAGTAGAAAPPPGAVDLCGHDEELCGVQSFSGFVDVAGAGSLFYWYFHGAEPAAAAVAGAAAETPPLVLWLQGGPGSPSMLGALFENGPLRLDRSGRLRRRSSGETWASRWPMLYIDSPVGTGWSFAAGDEGYARTQQDVARTLAAFLEVFAQRYPQAPRQLVLSGESYGGHYLPALGAFMLQHPGSFSLRAVAVGDGLTDPAVQVLTKPKEAFAFGLVDERQLGMAEALASAASSLALAGNFVAAAAKRTAMEDLVQDASMVNLYDVRTTEQYDWQDLRLNAFFGADTTKDLLHVPRNLSFGTATRVEECLAGDIMRSQRPDFEKLLAARVPVLLYQGQFDWKDGVVSNEAWIRQLDWSGREGYLTAERTVWRRGVDGQIAGYWRHWENLHQVVVLGAGHLVPMDQPMSALDMLDRFLSATTPAAAGRGTSAADQPLVV